MYLLTIVNVIMATTKYQLVVHLCVMHVLPHATLVQLAAITVHHVTLQIITEL